MTKVCVQGDGARGSGATNRKLQSPVEAQLTNDRGHTQPLAPGMLRGHSTLPGPSGTGENQNAHISLAIYKGLLVPGIKSKALCICYREKSHSYCSQNPMGMRKNQKLKEVKKKLLKSHGSDFQAGRIHHQHTGSQRCRVGGSGL